MNPLVLLFRGIPYVSEEDEGKDEFRAVESADKVLNLFGVERAMIPGLLSDIQHGTPAARDTEGLGDILFVVFKVDTSFQVV